MLAAAQRRHLGIGKNGKYRVIMPAPR